MLRLLTFVILAQSYAPIPGLTLREQASFLLSESGVRESLHLSTAESASVDSAFAAYDAARQGLSEQASDGDIVAVDRRFAAEAVKRLTEDERKALFAKVLRLRGVAAIADREVAAKVGLSGVGLARVQATAANMDKRDGDIPEQLANISLKEPEAATPQAQAASAAKRMARLKAAQPRIKARALARKREEAALLASLPQPVRLAWKKLVS